MSEVKTENRANRNITLDVLKLVASYMVVFIHVPFPGKIGALVDAMARFAVPLFFITSGFFCYQNTLETIKKKIFNILKLFVFAGLIYIVFNSLLALWENGIQSVFSYFSDFFSVKHFVKFFVLNVTASSYHLWFLPALIYAYIIQYFIYRFHINEKVWVVFSFIGIGLHLLFGEVFSIFNVIVSESLLRNFLLMGYPFFAVGLLMRRYKDALIKIHFPVLLSSFITGVLLMFGSRLLFGKNDLYLGTLFMTFSCVIFALKFFALKFPQWIIKLCSYSTNIYIFHILISKLFLKIGVLLHINTESIIFKWIWPITVCAITTLLAFIIGKVERKINYRKKRRE